ncbi:MAG: hypothetical protein IT280_11560 [Ignavibacteria bacterium]|nr:hypothetical protein [Ignavibacteria bacterium]
MKVQINYTRIALPYAPTGIINRDLLSKKINDGLSKKLVLLNAPAGFGKSTFVNSYLHINKSTFGWIRLHSDIDSSYILLLYIITALRKINNEFGKETLNTLELLGSEPKKILSQESALLSIISTFSNEYSLFFNNEITLVFDDLHELSSQSWLKNFLEIFLCDTPDNLKIVITTRYINDLNISSLKAKRNMLEITQKDLALSALEFSELAKKLYNIYYSDEEASNLVKYMGGWVTGIHLLLQVSEQDTNAAYFNENKLPENLFDFFASEIFIKLSAKIQEFLLKTSFLEDFDNDFCDKLLGINNSREIIENLSKRNIFIETIRSIDNNNLPSVKYCYNQLFKNFLRQLARKLSDEELTKIYNNIAEQYLKINLHAIAFDYYILAGKYESAFEQICIFFEEYFQQSNFEKLWNSISAFKSEFTEKNKLLLYYKGILLKFYKGEIETALNCYNSALDLNENDLNFKILCTQAKASILLTLGKGRINEAIELLNNILTEETAEVVNAKTYLLLGNAYFNIHKSEISESFLEKALQICSVHPNHELEHEIYSLLGNIKITNGDFVQSNHYYELALNKTKGLFKKIVIMGNLTVLYSRSAKYSKARELLIKSKDLLNKFKTPIFEILVKMTEYSLYFETGDYVSGLKLAEEINESALKLNNSNFIFLSYQFLGECNYYTGNAQKSIDFYDLAGRFIDESNETDEILLSILISISEIQFDNTPNIETKLLRAFTFLDAINSYYDKTIAGFYLAKYYLKAGNILTAVKYFEKSIDQASEREYRSFLLREYIFSEAIFQLPELDKSIKSKIENIRIDIFDLAELPWLAAEYKNSLREFIQKSYDIKVMLFGGLEFIVKNEKIKENEWKRKKRKLILCYLILNQGKQISKDKIIDLFFNETSIENSDNMFHQAVSNIRTALKSAYNASLTSANTGMQSDKQFIVYEGKQLKIASGISVYSDTGHFDSLIKKASQAENSSDSIALYKEAINLYSGDVLEGFYEPWCEEIRLQYKTKYIRVLEDLIKILFDKEIYNEAEIYAEILINKEPLNSIGYEILIRSLLSNGKQNTAKDKFDDLKRTYSEDLNENIPLEMEKRIISYFKQ